MLVDVLTLMYTLSEIYVYHSECGTRSVVVVVLLFYVHGKHLRSCRDGQLT